MTFASAAAVDVACSMRRVGCSSLPPGEPYAGGGASSSVVAAQAKLPYGGGGGGGGCDARPHLHCDGDASSRSSLCEPCGRGDWAEAGRKDGKGRREVLQRAVRLEKQDRLSLRKKKNATFLLCF